MKNFTSGNAQSLAAQRGWFVGHFINPLEAIRSTPDVEVKWGIHPAGDTRPSWASNKQATTLSILIQGQFEVHFASDNASLKQPGDYVIWGPDTPHSWHALEPSTVLTVRWPSLAGDSIDVSDPR